ncbi:MAG: peptide chain release factor N(5)-glutamine methyltransferase [Desulfobacterales bacterium]
MQDRSINPARNGELLNRTNWTILKLLQWATSYFKTRGIEGPRASAEILLAHILKLNRIDLYLQYDKPLSSCELSGFKASVKRRVKREPVAYIVGTRGFWSMTLAVTPDVLIPRPETELLVETALLLFKVNPGSDHSVGPKRVLELGTGSGAVTLALASEQPQHLFFASDRSTPAVVLAKENAKSHHMGKSANFFSADWFSPLRQIGQHFDFIISNPPYVPTRMISELQPEIRLYEPVDALDGGQDGLSSLRYLIRYSHRYLNPQGYLILEIGDNQKTAVERIAEKCDRYEKIVFIKDFSGSYRVVQMMKKLK